MNLHYIDWVDTLHFNIIFRSKELAIALRTHLQPAGYLPEQWGVFLAGITTENGRQHPKIPVWLILFSKSKTLSTALYLTLFFSPNASGLQDEQYFSVILCVFFFSLTSLKGHDGRNAVAAQNP